MKYTELKDKTIKELNELLKEKKLELFENRIKLRTMQLQDNSVIRKIKKDIARIKTAISAKG
jgi:large subunit ribosomal protein L29